MNQEKEINKFRIPNKLSHHKSIKEIDKEIEQIYTQMYELIEYIAPDIKNVDAQTQRDFAFTAQSMRLSVLLSQKTEKQTKWIIRFTVTLIAVAIIQIFIAFKQDFKATTNNEQIQIDTNKTHNTSNSQTGTIINKQNK